MVASDGGVFSFGDAAFYGSTGNIRLNKPIVGMAAVREAAGTGWSPPTVASSPSAAPRSTAPRATYASTSRWSGWRRPRRGWLLAGGLRRRHLRLRRRRLPRQHRQPGVEQAGGRHDGRARRCRLLPHRLRRWHLLVRSAPFYGSLGGVPLKHPIVSAAATPNFNGYWFTESAGLVSNFGQAGYYGSAPSAYRGRSSAWPRRPATGGSSGGTSPRGPTATTSANSSVPIFRRRITRLESSKLMARSIPLRMTFPIHALRRRHRGQEAV